ncbi:transposase [Paractinoplanes rhizophilus]|uniref:Transposase n=1 Tax=Paractinoplanes rhizophilus TaxID=1416877 RepID=A0ABW2I2W3_9ACTN|nr:transposase [Actinoplanes sp.]
MAAKIAKAGEHPDVVLEATYSWYWAVDVLQDAGAQVHLAHTLGVNGFAYRRVKNDQHDAADSADLLRMNRLPEAYVAPPAVRELRERLVSSRARIADAGGRNIATVAVTRSCSPWSTTACATGASVPSPKPRPRREQAPRDRMRDRLRSDPHPRMTWSPFLIDPPGHGLRSPC